MQPSWFQQHLEQTPTVSRFDLDGTSIHYRHWKNQGKPGLLLVHGHAAHAHWWDFIAPAFIDEYDVVAIDLSGSGDSDHRRKYSARLFAEEIVACIDDARLKHPVVAGHSFGGSMTRVAAYLFPTRIDAAILIDSAIPTRKSHRTPPPMPRGRERYYASLEEGMRRFRLRPAQPCANQYIRDYIASQSLRHTDQGYCFKLDGAVFARMPAEENLPVAAEMIQSLKIPVGLIYGEQSKFFPKEFLTYLEGIIDKDLITGIPDAHHHVFLDQPLPFIEALANMLKRIRARA
ncbi:MAG: alpha/beta hydrolase [Gammaproteobacteria bacterium]|nr:alpha/beta hydrolase [Gammaproteobacteria bacterium]MBT4492897.1 alpha/beta hydrolase [Gammaproteobacteria bacterium]MBT7369237.1 alpha/beta hydrolase [Gammaproteobacteria bacterium]